MRRFLKVIIIFLMATCLNAQEKSIAQQADEAYQNGNYLLSLKLYKKIMYDDTLDDQSRNFGLGSMSESLMQMEPDLAIREIEIIFKEYPYDDEEILVPYATAFIKKGDYNKAKEIVDKILVLTKNDKYLYEKLVTNGLEKMHIMTKKEIVVEDAYPEFVDELYNKSLRYYKTWKETKKPYMYHKALFNIDSAINIEPNRSDLWFLKGMILSETKTHLQLELALTSFIQAIIIRPKNDPAQLMVAQTLFNLGRYEEAIVRYKWIFKTYKKEAMNYMTLYPFAVSYLALNKADPLLGYFKNVLSKYDEYNKDMWFIRAVIYDKMGWKKEAIDVIEWLIEKSEDNKKRKYFEFLLAKYKGAIK